MPYIEQNGHRLFYESFGPSTSDSAIILHHGMAQWRRDWETAGWLDTLNGRRVIALDAIGHGGSDRPTDIKPYTVESRAEAVLSLADAEGLESFSFFGFSMGGRVGFELATTHPDRIDRLVVGGMHGLRPDKDRRNLERRVAFLRSSKWRMVERAIGVKSDDGRSNDPDSLALSTEAVLHWSGAESRLPDMRISCLMYCGTNDSILEYAQATSKLMPNASLVELQGAGHAASFYSSEEAKKHVKNFLNS